MEVRYDVYLEDENGNRFIGKGQSTDAVEASIKAYINGIIGFIINNSE